MKLIADRKISMLSFDLDGTLLNSNSEISNLTLDRIQEAMKKGVRVTLATGRVPPMLEVYADILGIDGPYVSANGALIVHHKSKNILYEKRISVPQLMEICSFLNRHGPHYSLQTGTVLYYTNENPRIHMLDKYNEIARRNGRAASKFAYLKGEEALLPAEAVYKLIIQPQTEALSGILKEYLEGSRYFDYTYSMAGLFEVTAKGTDKGAGISKVAQYYHIPMKEVCVFGDYDNDISAFRKAGVSIAMGNACDSLKEIAAYHTASNDENGIAKAIDAIWKCL